MIELGGCGGFIGPGSLYLHMPSRVSSSPGIKQLILGPQTPPVNDGEGKGENESFF